MSARRSAVGSTDRSSRRNGRTHTMTMVPDPPRAPSQPLPWGIATTFGWLVFSFLIGALVATVFFAMFQGEKRLSTTYDGVLLTISALTSIPVQIGVLAWA